MVGACVGDMTAIACPIYVLTSLSLAEVRRDFLASLDKPLHRADGFVEVSALCAGQFEFNDSLDALRSDHDRNAGVKVLHAILAVEIGGAWQDALLVQQIALGHRDGR